MVSPQSSTINLMDLRNQPGTVLDRVFYRNERIVVERAGQPRAVLVPVREYQDIERRRDEARARVMAWMQKVQQQTARYNPAELQAIIDEAIKAVRQENRRSYP